MLFIVLWPSAEANLKILGTIVRNSYFWRIHSCICMPLRTETSMPVQPDNDDSSENKLLDFPYKTKAETWQGFVVVLDQKLTFLWFLLSSPKAIFPYYYLKGGFSLKIQESSTLTATCTSKMQYAILASKGKGHQSILPPNYTILWVKLIITDAIMLY